MVESTVLTIGGHQREGSNTATPRSEKVASGDWFSALRRYFLAIALGNLIWEFAQLPLYTIWHQGTAREIVFAAVHCTGGDVLIAGMSLLAALMVLGTGRWPHARFRVVALATILGGLAYTVFSEWLNTEIRGSWAYSEWMPTLPLIGAGLSPFAQWMVVPAVGLWWAYRPFGAMAKQGRGTL